jgi:hypothetical protein
MGTNRVILFCQDMADVYVVWSRELAVSTSNIHRGRALSLEAQQKSPEA